MMRVTRTIQGLTAMKLNKYTFFSKLALISLFGIALLSFACVEEKTHHYEGMRSFKLVVNPVNGFGSKESPLKFSNNFATDGQCASGRVCHVVTIGAYAVDVFGNEYKDFNGKVLVKIVPGEVSVKELEVRNGKIGEWTTNANGELELVRGVDISIRHSFGPAKIWIEDSLKTFNFDGSRVVQTPSYSTAVSQEFVFESETIEMVQYNPDLLAGPSPLNAEFVSILGREGHNIVVTNVVATGFYITDLDAEIYNSLFIFTFSQPTRVEIGDRVCEVSGGVAEFTGMTQLQFPSWGIQNKERSTAQDQDPAPEDGDAGSGTCKDKETGLSRPCTREELEVMAEIVDCSPDYAAGKITDPTLRRAFGKLPLPDPKIIEPAILTKANRTALEKLEASIVTITDVRLSSRFIDCDDNGNGRIESGTSESDCRNTCNNDLTCTELSNLRSYDQLMAMPRLVLRVHL